MYQERRSAHVFRPVCFAMFIAMAMIVTARPTDAQRTDAPITYVVSLDRSRTQMVEITMTVPHVESRTIDVSLPTWRPGKYEILDFAGTVRDVRAFDAQGRRLPIRKTRKSTWRIDTSDADTIRVSYQIYANSLGDRTRHVDATHAFLSGSSVFMFTPDRLDHPVRVRIDAPDEWQIASGMNFADDDPRTLVAANYHVLVDSPIEIGQHDVHMFEALGAVHEIVLWADPDLTYDEDVMIEDFRKIVESQASIFGALPYERYVFLIHAGKGAGGGTEHLNSTIMQTSASSIEGSTSRNNAYQRFLGLVSHEFFHTWNVKQLRPAGITPYDYLQENYTTLFWVAEGTTSYYDDLTLARTGLISDRNYFGRLARAITSYHTRPGARVQSLAESSFDAWIKFNKSTPDDVNSTVSFYSVGAIISLALDMEIRTRTDNRVSLDDVMRRMYEQFPLESGGYTPEDLLRTIESMTESSFQSFFEQHVQNTVQPDFERLLEVVGLELYFDPARGADIDTSESEDDGESETDASSIPMRAAIGINLSGTRVRSVESTGPAYDKGIVPGDELLAINDDRMVSGNMDDLLEQYKPGDVITLTFFRDDTLHQIELKLGAAPHGSWAIRRMKSPTEAQEAAFRSWMARPATEKPNDAADESPTTTPDSNVDDDRNDDNSRDR